MQVPGGGGVGGGRWWREVVELLAMVVVTMELEITWRYSLLVVRGWAAVTRVK